MKDVKQGSTEEGLIFFSCSLSGTLKTDAIAHFSFCPDHGYYVACILGEQSQVSSNERFCLGWVIFFKGIHSIIEN